MITKLGNVSDHCDVAWLESVEAVDCGLEGGDRFGEIVLAVVPRVVRCGGNGGGDCEVFCKRVKTRSRRRMCRRQHHIENVDGTNGSD